MPARRRLDEVRARYDRTLAPRVVRRMVEVGGYDRAIALSAQAFIALVPMLLVVAAITPDGGRGAGGATVIADLGLSGGAASELTTLVRRPPGVETVTVVGTVLLVNSVLGFTRSLQRTYVAAWGLPPAGFRGLAHGVLAAVALIVELTTLALLGPVVTVAVSALPLGVVAHATAAVLLWWPVQRILLGGRVGWRDLLPGAVLTGIGQAVVLGLSGFYLPLVIAHESDRYGLIGVAFALLSWLLVLGLLLVLSAVVGAELPRAGPEGAGRPSVVRWAADADQGREPPPRRRWRSRRR